MSLQVRDRRHRPGDGGGALYGEIVFRGVFGMFGTLKLSDLCKQQNIIE